MYLYLSLFFIYAFLGWCTEVVYSVLNNGKFTNRGFLNGPVCPIYGFGVALVIRFLYPIKENLLILFLGSIILTSSLEWITGLALEKVFNKKWWDYTDEPFNLGGYICLKFSIMWGIACILVVEVIHPIVLRFVGYIPKNIGFILLLSFIITIVVDIVATVRSIAKLNKNLKHVDELAVRIRNISDDLGEMLSNETIKLMEKNQELKVELNEKKGLAMVAVEKRHSEFDQRIKDSKRELSELNEKYNELINKRHFGEKRIFNAFPKMYDKRHKEAFEELKKRILNMK